MKSNLLTTIVFFTFSPIIPIHAVADQEPTDNYALSFAAQPVRDASFELRKKIDRSNYLFIDIGYSVFSEERIEEVETFRDSGSLERIKTNSHSTNRSISIIGAIGYRHYFTDDSHRIFSSIAFGPKGNHQRFDYYYDNVADQPSNTGSSYDIGVHGKIAVGVEYFFSPTLSINGIYLLSGDYIGWSLGGNQQSKNTGLRHYPVLTLDYYW